MRVGRRCRGHRADALGLTRAHRGNRDRRPEAVPDHDGDAAGHQPPRFGACGGRRTSANGARAGRGSVDRRRPNTPSWPTRCRWRSSCCWSRFFRWNGRCSCCARCSSTATRGGAVHRQVRGELPPDLRAPGSASPPERRRRTARRPRNGGRRARNSPAGSSRPPRAVTWTRCSACRPGRGVLRDGGGRTRTIGSAGDRAEARRAVARRRVPSLRSVPFGRSWSTAGRASCGRTWRAVISVIDLDIADGVVQAIRSVSNPDAAISTGVRRRCCRGSEPGRLRAAARRSRRRRAAPCSDRSRNRCRDQPGTLRG